MSSLDKALYTWQGVVVVKLKQLEDITLWGITGLSDTGKLDVIIAAALVKWSLNASIILSSHIDLFLTHQGEMVFPQSPLWISPTSKMYRGQLDLHLIDLSNGHF